MSFLTSRWPFPQKEQERFVGSSVLGLVISSSPSGLFDLGGAVRDDLVDEAVGARLFRAHEEIAVGVGLDLPELLARVPGKEFV